MVTEQTTKLKKQRMIEALRMSLGVVSPALQEAGVSRGAFYFWKKDDPQFKEDVENLDEEAIDFAETSLFTQIKEKNTTATIFYLKTKGKKRGYVERIETIDLNKKKEIKDRTQEELEEFIRNIDEQIARLTNG